MRVYVITFAFSIACSDATTSVTDASSPNDAAKTDDAIAATDAKTDVVEASTSDDAASDASVSQGACAACTANDCLTQLQTCGASQPCVDDLVTFNNCLSANQENCGTTFAAGGADQASLWSCLAAKCPQVCGTQ